MTATPSTSYARRAIAAARVASGCVLLAAALVFIGWLLDVPALKSLYLPGPTLKTNAALCLACGALASLLTASMRARRGYRWAAWLLSAVQIVIAALTLSEHLVGWNLGIDQLLASEAAGALATMSPNRMGPPASIANVLVGLALLFAGSTSARRRGLSQLCGLLTCAIAVLPLIGFAYGIGELYAIARYTGISLLNSISLLTLGLAIQAGRPEGGFAALLCRDDEAGEAARRLLPAAVLLPFGIGWLLARSLNAGFVDAPFAISAMALVLIVGMGGVIWGTGLHLVRSLDTRAAAERELAERERTVREADQQKAEFLATLSHELRNPLAPIRFAVGLLDGPAASARRARETIERQVRHLTVLIDDLLDLTRITRNKLELHLRATELQRLVDDAVDAVSPEITRGRHQVAIELPPDPVWVHADPNRVVQMLVNLLKNATRFSEPGAGIVVHTWVGDHDVAISVRDYGRGIAAADLDRVFDRFVQVGDRTQGGLGIGLAIVKALAELHGGHVEARSDGPGHGAEFRVMLPRADVPSIDEEEGPTWEATPCCRIMIVDDNRDAADTLSELLIAFGHNTVVAYDGQTALRHATEFKPQAALLDIGMAGMDGYQLAAQLRAYPELPDLFLVAITGWGQEEDRRRALAAGFDAHLTKPADPAQIMALVAARFPSSPGARIPAAEPHS